MQVVESADERQMIPVFQLGVSPRHDEFAVAADRQDEYVTRQLELAQGLVAVFVIVYPDFGDFLVVVGTGQQFRRCPDCGPTG